MVMNNLNCMESLIANNPGKSKRPVKGAPNIVHQPRDSPLFRLTASLLVPEIVITPQSNEMFKMMIKFIRSIIDSSKHFHRWMNGTCILTPPQKINDEEEAIIFSFQSDLVASQSVIALVVNLNVTINRAFADIHKWVDSWRKYRPLWKVDKVSTLEKFAQKKPGPVQYDEKLIFYSKMAKEVESQGSSKDIAFIRINLKPLQNAIYDEANQWVSSIGRHLNVVSKENLDSLQARFRDFDRDLGLVPQSLDDLTFVLNVIANINDASEEVEIQYKDVVEAYRTLHMYNLDVDPEENVLAENLPKQWEDMVDKAKVVDAGLVAVKAKFTEHTQLQSRSFKLSLQRYKEDFALHGPGANNLDMDEGLIRLVEAKKTVASLSLEREGLVRAEKVFNMTITSYPELFELEVQLKELDLIYALYSDVKEAVATWSKTLWANLDISVLNKGIEAYTTRLKKLPKELKQLPPYNVVAEKIFTFKDSIPLFSDLKNEALRDRHWKKLMEITGRTFDMSPDTFTLERLFAMNLHEHAEAIGDIVGGAMKELSIENAIKEVEATWKAQKVSFTLTLVHYCQVHQRN
jgi:dynein heavy chain, axonemal